MTNVTLEKKSFEIILKEIPKMETFVIVIITRKKKIWYVLTKEISFK